METTPALAGAIPANEAPAAAASKPADAAAVGGEDSEENPGGSLPPSRAVEIATGMPGPA